MIPLVHFEIHAEKPERAIKFYKTVFGWEIKEWVFPDGKTKYWMVMTKDKNEGSKIKGKYGQGIDGGLVPRRGESPKQGQPVNAYVCTMEVDSFDSYAKKILDNGGTIALPKMPVPSVGWLGYFIDTEGNIFGLMQNDPEAK